MLKESVLAFTMLTGANMADAISTQHVVHAGGYEAMNPGLYGRDASRIVSMKLLISAAETGVFVGLRKKHRVWAWAWVGGIVGANLYMTHRNETLARNMRTR